MERMTRPESALQLAEALEAWLRTPGPLGSGITQQQTYPYKALLELAKWTKTRCQEGDDPWPKISRDALAEKIIGDSEHGELRKIVVLSQLHGLVEDRRSRLEGFHAVKALGFRPVIWVTDDQGGKGIAPSVQIGFDALTHPHPEGAQRSEAADLPLDAHEDAAGARPTPVPALTYIEYSEEKPKLSWAGKLMFRHRPIRVRSIPGVLIVGWAVVSVLVAAVLSISTLAGMVIPKNQESVRYLYIMILGLGEAWLAWHFGARPWIQLVDDRIRMADDFWTSGARQAQFELVRKDDGRYIQLVHYVSPECPICAAKIYVESGRREFHHRLVGRCSESPREHVFSFDRVTLKGYPLRQVQHGYVGSC